MSSSEPVGFNVSLKEFSVSLKLFWPSMIGRLRSSNGQLLSSCYAVNW